MTVKSQRIGDFFKDYRQRSMLKPQAICQALELASEDMIYKYENGQARIPLALVYSFANLYDIPTDQVLELFYKLSEHSDDVETVLERNTSKSAL